MCKEIDGNGTIPQFIFILDKARIRSQMFDQGRNVR